MSEGDKFSDLIKDPAIKKMLEELMKKAGVKGNPVEEADLAQRTVFEFEKFYGDPVRAYEGLMKVAAFMIDRMIKSPQEVEGVSPLLMAMATLQPLVVMMIEMSKGLKIIASETQEAIVYLTEKNPEVLKEANISLEKVEQMNKRARAWYDGELKREEPKKEDG